jgi:hypothetical protein
MAPLKIVAIVLIAAGLLALAVGSFTYVKDVHEARWGPIEMKVSEKETVNIPAWAGLGAIAIGGGLLFAGNRKGRH